MSFTCTSSQFQRPNNLISGNSAGKATGNVFVVATTISSKTSLSSSVIIYLSKKKEKTVTCSFALFGITPLTASTTQMEAEGNGNGNLREVEDRQGERMTGRIEDRDRIGSQNGMNQHKTYERRENGIDTSYKREQGTEQRVNPEEESIQACPAAAISKRQAHTPRGKHCPQTSRATVNMRANRPGQRCMTPQSPPQSKR
ncbi:hypothetical protein ALC56_11983 [Trachymyrmex septentrionalis]|uniref:Uncharacterized protein n=1 Tax=Trachymyrmex septentrionalis TaxID=34720 RepID=A0A195EZJ7_9HYME|nr:hypothetical protein ALC56_11983 [Trachymyrmex septentrionalis]